MNKSEFIEFIEEIGFKKHWSSNPNKYTISTDTVGSINSNGRGFLDHIDITLENDIIYISKTNFNSGFISGENILNFKLENFKSESKIIFIEKISEKFLNPPEKLKSYLRDFKINMIIE
jgi:hypothetical protein